MNRFDTFTAAQKDTYQLIHDLDEEYMKAIDPASFVLNEKLIAIKNKIAEVQSKCNHIFENGECIVCGKEENK